MTELVDVYSGELEAESMDGLASISFLYDLLIDRDPIANISHKVMPTFDQHRAFVDSRTYRSWDIVCADNQMVGAIYLSKQNEIGVSILKAHQGHGYGPMAICLLMNRHPGEQFLANINPRNTRSITMFEGLGFELKQVTYAKENKMSDFVQYRRKQIAELRPWVPGESMASVSISAPDAEAGSPKNGDMIARNPKNHADQWLVAAQYFADNFEPI